MSLECASEGHGNLLLSIAGSLQHFATLSHFPRAAPCTSRAIGIDSVAAAVDMIAFHLLLSVSRCRCVFWLALESVDRSSEIAISCGAIVVCKYFMQRETPTRSGQGRAGQGTGTTPWQTLPAGSFRFPFGLALTTRDDQEVLVVEALLCREICW